MSYYEKYLKYKQKYIDLKNTLEGGTVGLNDIPADTLFNTGQFIDCKELIKLASSNKQLFKDTIINKRDILYNIKITA